MRDYSKDIEEIPKLAKEWAGQKAVDFIEIYAVNRKMAISRVNRYFFKAVAAGQIKTHVEDTYDIID